MGEVEFVEKEEPPLRPGESRVCAPHLGGGCPGSVGSQDVSEETFSQKVGPVAGIPDQI